MIFSIALTVLCTSSRSYFSGRLRRLSISNVASCSQQALRHLQCHGRRAGQKHLKGRCKDQAALIAETPSTNSARHFNREQHIHKANF